VSSREDKRKIRAGSVVDREDMSVEREIQTSAEARMAEPVISPGGRVELVAATTWQGRQVFGGVPKTSVMLCQGLDIILTTTCSIVQLTTYQQLVSPYMGEVSAGMGARRHLSLDPMILSSSNCGFR